MELNLTVNGKGQAFFVAPGDTLLTVLRHEGYFGVKHGCETGECGACAVILNGKLVNTCTLLAAQAEGATILTIEGLSPDEPGRQGEVDPIQQAFIETGAIQCGYCTPAQILAAKALLDRELYPSQAQVREALAGVLCRCTGYVKPVEAVLRAAAYLRGEEPPSVDAESFVLPPDLFAPSPPPFEEVEPPPDFDSGGHGPRVTTRTVAPPLTVVTAPSAETKVVGQPKAKVDAVKLAKGRPVFTDDFALPGMLYGALLTSPHAHARIRHIDASAARKLPGVHAVVTYEDVPRVSYASGGQSYPNPLPYDQFSLDNKVRHVGDRVAVVAAETPEIAQKALTLIEVDYEVLPAVLDPEEAMQPGAPIIHDELDAVGIHDAVRNIVHHIHVDHGHLEAGFAEADYIFENEYRVHQVQHAQIEPHVCITYWDEDDRLTVRTSTQVPFHTRRMLAPLIGLPLRRIRVIKPRIGGGFGGKQEMLLEDLCAHLTIATGRPVRMEYTREQEFTSARTRHPQVLRYRTGVRKDGTLAAMQLRMIGDTGAYGTHGLTVQFVAGFRGLTTYKADALQFDCHVVYTNKPVAGAYRGYGAPQAEFALESHMEEIAVALGIDPVEFKRLNWVKEGDELVLARAMGEGREGYEQLVTSSGLEECVRQGAKAIGWERRNMGDAYRLDPAQPHIRRGLGMAVAMHGSGIAGLDMGAASLKLNDDGSFNLLVGATDLGTGSDTILAQIAAETLGVPLENILVYASDTDLTPFDTGAYASSTTYISGGAVLKAAEQVRLQIVTHVAKHMLSGADPGRMWLEDAQVWARDGRSVSLEKVALHSLHQEEQHQIMATASHTSYASPPPFAAQYAEVKVDIETGQVEVERLVTAVDCGVAINPVTAAGQVEGGMAQALGYAVCEEMAYDDRGHPLTADLTDYKIYRSDEMPELAVILVQTYEPTGPYGAKAIAEIPKDGVAPAIASAIYYATGVRLRELPFTPERVWKALQP
ncbi:MAG: molybdopterin-dependent oxidoreductase [Anaerolineae bacterium]|nr:MAG: molybdopterin-dependent oxidoreductase [Anaerolineae bacterium]